MAHSIIEAKNNLSILLKETQLPTLLDFWAPWCGPCKQLNPVIDDIAKHFANKLQVIKVNVDDNEDEISTYSIKKIPTLIFLNKEGQEVKLLRGFHAFEKLVSIIEELSL